MLTKDQGFEKFDEGVYEMTDNGLVTANLLKLIKDGVVTLVEKGILQPRNREDFLKLFK